MSQLNQQLIIDFNFEPEYNFDNFVKTTSTGLAYDAALLTARKPGSKCNPLVIFGEKGVGKTHLLRAIGNWSRSNSKGLRVLYLDSKNIITKFKRLDDEFDVISLVKRYKDVDILIIDDIDIVLKQPHFDEKIFHLYNHLIQRGKQLVFASSVPPHLLNFTDLNLKSRLKSGLSVKIEKMNDKDKRNVIKKLSKDFEISVPHNVANYILYNAPRDFESLHKIICQLNGFSLETKKKITISLVKKILKV